MELDLEMRFTERYKPSTRHRKWRYREATETVHVSVADVTASQAPVAIVVHRSEGDTALRWHEGRLFERGMTMDYGERGEPRQRRATTPSDVEEQLRYAAQNPSYRSEHDEALAAVQRAVSGWLLIDGEVWAVANEPRYDVATFGMGYNHGGTALMVTEHGEPEFGRKRIFSALEGDAAFAEAIKTAQERGDSESIASIKQGSRIEVLIPAAVKLPTQAQLAERERQRLREQPMRVTFKVSRKDGRQPSPAEARAAVLAFVDRLNGQLGIGSGGTVYLDPGPSVQVLEVEGLVVSE